MKKRYYNILIEGERVATVVAPNVREAQACWVNLDYDARTGHSANKLSGLPFEVERGGSLVPPAPNNQRGR